MTEHVFADVTPLIMYLGSEKWVHPYIKDWYNPTTESGHDVDVYRMYLKNTDNENLYVYFKSNYIDEAINRYDFNDVTKQKQELFADPYINCQEVYMSLYVTLIEDCWTLTPPAPRSFKTSKEFCSWIESIRPEQFCFTEFGEKVSDFLQKDHVVNFFSLDCGLVCDETGTEWDCDS